MKHWRYWRRIMTDHGIKVIADHYGKKHQTIKTMEELAELIQALAREDVENIKEELADVMVMLEQIKYLYGFSEIEINRIMFSKIVIQLGRAGE